MNWKEFEMDLLAVVAKALQELQVEYSNERFYAFALLTDSSAMTIALAANSVEALESKILSENEEDREDSRAYYQWAVSEWQYAAWRGELFRTASKKLREATGRDDIATFREDLYSVMIAVLNKLCEARPFQRYLVQEPTLFVTVTDNDSAEILENYSAKVLNSPAVYDNFLNRYKG